MANNDDSLFEAVAVLVGAAVVGTVALGVLGAVAKAVSASEPKPASPPPTPTPTPTYTATESSSDSYGCEHGNNPISCMEGNCYIYYDDED